MHATPSVPRGDGPDRPDTDQLRVALANDFEVVVAGLARMLEPFDGLHVVDLAVQRAPEADDIDVALFDTYGRPGPDTDRLKELVGQPNVAHVAVYTFDFEPHQVREALDIGVRGYLWKGAPASELVDAIRRVGTGEVVVSEVPPRPHRMHSPSRWPGQDRGLSRRESEVLALMIQGLSNRQIASALHLGTESVKTHVSSLFRKLGVANRVQATALTLDDPAFARRSVVGASR